jgi:DNA invertase Pin-like site-specific DNA recombinase
LKNQQQNIAAIYCRLSRDDGGDAESNSIGNQRELLRQYAKAQGLVVKSEYVDDGISGTTFERPSFKRMIEDIKSGLLGVVLCKDLSRLGRNNAMVAYYTEIFFPENDIQFIAVNDGIDTFHGENEIMGFKSIINEYYARDISKKVRSSLRTLAVQGQFTGTNAPYGYRKDPEDRHHLLVDEESAVNLRRMFQLAAAGETAQRIAQIFSKEQILTPQAYVSQCTGMYKTEAVLKHPTLWQKISVQAILKNQVYLGHMVAQKQAAKSFKQKKLINRPESEWIKVEHTHEALVDEQTFEKVQRLMSVKRPAKTTEFNNIFRGLVRCSTCGCTLSLHDMHKNNDANYSCSNYRRNHTCTAHYIRFLPLYDLVLRKIKKVSAIAKLHENDLNAFVEHIWATSERSDSRKDAKQMERCLRRMKELDTIVKKLLEQNALGGISDARFLSMSGGYEAEHEALQKQVDALQAKQSEAKADNQNAFNFQQIVLKYTDVQELTASLLYEFIDRIVIFDGSGRGQDRRQRVEIHFKFVGLLPDSV